jgi:lipopolysaccharide export system protein LptC
MTNLHPGATRTAHASRHRSDFLAARRHSFFVRALKIGLPLASLAILAGFAGLTVLARTEMPDVGIDLSSTAVKDGKLVMANPRLNGYTGDNKPYSVEAERATQDVGNTAEIALENISANIPFSGDDQARIAAPAAKYDSTANTLAIERPFTVDTTDGMQGAFGGAFVDIRSGTLTTDKPVDISYKGARITARSMQVTDNGKVLVFEDRVRLELTPGSVKRVSGDGTGSASEGN